MYGVIAQRVLGTMAADVKTCAVNGDRMHPDSQATPGG